jgi:hypothetical protein
MMEANGQGLTLRILPGLEEETAAKEGAAAGMDWEGASRLVTLITRGSMGGQEEMVQQPVNLQTRTSVRREAMAAGESDFLRERHCRFLAPWRQTEDLPQDAVVVLLRVFVIIMVVIIILICPQQLEEVLGAPFSCGLATCKGTAWFPRMEAQAGGLLTPQTHPIPAEVAEAEAGVG